MSRRSRRRLESDTGMGSSTDDRVFTPLIDIFLAVVFFLMVGFTQSGQVVSVTDGVELPTSTGIPAQEELTVGISPDRISIGGEPLLSVNDAMASGPGSEPYLIPLLYEELLSIRRDIEATAGPDERIRGVLAIQGDQEIPYAVLSRVMYSARKAGFQGFNLHVNQDESAGGPAEAATGATAMTGGAP